MSREIDTSKPKKLSLDDRIYLADRGRLPAGAKVPTQEEREDANERVEEPNVIAENAGAEVEEGPNSGERDLTQLPYGDWTNEELKDEARVRELSGFSSLNHDGLVDLLTEDDESEAIENGE